ncbi:MAG: YraN family protein [Methylococcales bacterium]|jgi:putative endonuclease|nr:YraN family protein [Methylococcaceae bacterium]
MTNFRPLHLLKGEQSEQLACNYLLQQGLSVIAKNFRCQYGELDLIMQDADTLVIVEVRFRKSNKYGGALESITPKKQSRIIATTQYYLMRNNWHNAIRFDVITLSGNMDIHWIKNAFQ